MKVLANTLKAGDKVMPPAREVQLWMRRSLKERGLAESALHLTITDIQEGNADKGGRWLVVTSDQTAEWNAAYNGKARPFVFKVRPETPWTKV